MEEQTNNEHALVESIRTQFSNQEWVERCRHISTIKNFENAWVAAQKAINQIEEKGFYKPYKNMTEFLVRTFGWSDRRAQQVLNARKVVAALPEGKRTTVTSERVARELGKVAPEHREAVLDEAVTIGTPTAPLVTQISKKYQKSDFVKDREGVPIPQGDASYHWLRRNDAEEVLSKIHAAQRAVQALNENDVMWHESRLQDVIGLLHSAWKYFKWGIPEHVCWKCKGIRPTNCTVCHGRGVLGEWEWNKQSGKEKEFLAQMGERERTGS